MVLRWRICVDSVVVIRRRCLACVAHGGASGRAGSKPSFPNPLS